MSQQSSNKDETIRFLEDEVKLKESEINEMKLDISNLMDERTKVHRKCFKLDQRVKGLQQVTIKDYKQKVSKKVQKLDHFIYVL